MPAAPKIEPTPEEEFDEPLSCRIVLPQMRLPLKIHPPHPLTDEEILALCSENDGLDLESDSDGSITFIPLSGYWKSHLNAILGAYLGEWARQNGTGAVFGPDLGVRFPDLTLRSPDAAWLSSERVNEAEEQEKTNPGFLHLCPDFVAELRSHDDSVSHVEAKMRFWMARGAQLGWLIDPIRKLATIYRAGQEPETLIRPEFLDGDGPLAGFRLEMKKFWE